ncbi:hypothetical protein [Rufibacter quisquiliarum]|uniref:Uncharacterized protein n=1 Tax=Rufibacter quisquiliarum TaxID=1549639 RepID=A0A839GEW2_9BACT|nr:hypothetical protein [Rufibacter quisquiliarum]MBA9076083.1 hypothetical protein [Rufibacter quisquiliarum]
METPQSLTAVTGYLRSLAERYEPLASFGYGFEEEQGSGGNTAYPHLFLEAEMEVTEPNPGLDGYNVALLFLDKPQQQGTQPGTAAELHISSSTKQIADEVLEILRMEQQLLSIKVGSRLSLSQFGPDSAYGWRVEVYFEIPKAIDRAAIRQRLTPLQ